MKKETMIKSTKLVVALMLVLGLLVTSTTKADETGTQSTNTYKYASIIKNAADKFDVPAALIAAIIKVESNFNPNAVSHMGAAGLMQLDPSTRIHLKIHNPFDPLSNIYAGARYISSLLKLFKGDVKLAIAAYNAGPANVKKYGSIPPFKQTREFVPKVMKHYSDYRDLDV